ncbi:MAG: molybdopterin-binding protein [Desulfobacterales bacterium]|nr:molybdopterin-binding protein [Desulfobacterales bacterium]
MVLCHDITRIVPGESKGPAFQKGHVVRTEDVSALLDLGKRSLYVLDLAPDELHENDAARRIASAAAGTGLTMTEPVEGKVNLLADFYGLLKIDVAALRRINEIEDVIFSTLHTGQAVRRNQPVAGTRIIPLVTGKEKVEAVEAVCRSDFPVVEVRPFASLTVGVVTTGSEVYHGRIEDRFGPVIQVKFAELGSRVLRQEFVSDDIDMTVKAIRGLIDDGAQMIAVTGGMSVDPDDQTPAAIRAAGAEVVTYGAPVLPGAMFMLAYIGEVPVVGLPGCVMYYRASIFDLVVPRLLAGEAVTRQDIAAMGHGGFCRSCADCRFPNCSFGK